MNIFIIAILSNRFLPWGQSKELFARKQHKLPLWAHQSKRSCCHLISGVAITLMYSRSDTTIFYCETKLKAILLTGLTDGEYGSPFKLAGPWKIWWRESTLTLNSDVVWMLKIMHQESSHSLSIPRDFLKHQEQSEFQHLHANQAIHMWTWAFFIYYSFLTAFWNFQSFS